MAGTLPRRLAVPIAATLVVTACSAGAATGVGPAETDISIEIPESMGAADAERSSTAAATPDDAGALRQRCIDTILVLDERIDAEGFVYPEEDDEVSEEELERQMAPEVAFVDGVAGPDDRPDLVPMPDFDARTLPILQLDRYREACFEQGLVTEAEVYGDEEDDDWCEELADFAIEDVRGFAAEEGDDAVREAFDACGLPNPLDP